MTPGERLAQIRERVEKATPGEWAIRSQRFGGINGAAIVAADGTKIGTVTLKADKPYSQKQADADLIAHAPADLRYLCERVAELQSALTNLVAAHDGYRQGMGPCVCAAHEDARRAREGQPDRPEGGR